MSVGDPHKLQRAGAGACGLVKTGTRASSLGLVWIFHGHKFLLLCHMGFLPQSLIVFVASVILKQEAMIESNYQQPVFSLVLFCLTPKFKLKFRF